MGLKEARKRAGLTAREVATTIGVSFQNVYNWEAGSYFPEASRLIELAELYGCTVDELLRDPKQNGMRRHYTAQPGGMAAKRYTERW